MSKILRFCRGVLASCTEGAFSKQYAGFGSAVISNRVYVRLYTRSGEDITCYFVCSLMCCLIAGRCLRAGCFKLCWSCEFLSTKGQMFFHWSSRIKLCWITWSAGFTQTCGGYEVIKAKGWTKYFMRIGILWETILIENTRNRKALQKMYVTHAESLYYNISLQA